MEEGRDKKSIRLCFLSHPSLPQPYLDRSSRLVPFSLTHTGCVFCVCASVHVPKVPDTYCGSALTACTATQTMLPRLPLLETEDWSRAEQTGMKRIWQDNHHFRPTVKSMQHKCTTSLYNIVIFSRVDFKNIVKFTGRGDSDNRYGRKTHMHRHTNAQSDVTFNYRYFDTAGAARSNNCVCQRCLGLFLLSQIVGAHLILFNAVPALFTPWFASIHRPENPTSFEKRGRGRERKFPWDCFYPYSKLVYFYFSLASALLSCNMMSLWSIFSPSAGFRGGGLKKNLHTSLIAYVFKHISPWCPHTPRC